MVRIVLFAKLDFATRCKSVICATPSKTRVFATHFQFGEFRAILRGVVVKKIHIFRGLKICYAEEVSGKTRFFSLIFCNRSAINKLFRTFAEQNMKLTQNELRRNCRC